MAAGILITSASRKVSLVQAFREAAKAAGGGRVVAADISPLAPALYLADAAHLVPRSDDPAFVPELLAICRAEQIRLVVPTRDEELPVLAAARDRFAEARVHVLVADAAAIAVCQDKALFAATCHSAGFRTPRIMEAPRVDDLPVFIRPRTGKGGRGARPVYTAVELAAAIAELGAMALVQELVEEAEFSIDLFIDPRDGRAISCVPRERVLVVAGESQVSRTVRDEQLQTEVIGLASALGLTGHLTVQAFRRGDEVLFIEVNPRYGGGAALGFAAGARTAEYALRVALGLPLEPQLAEYEVGLVMLRYSQDRFVRSSELLGSWP